MYIYIHVCMYVYIYIYIYIYIIYIHQHLICRGLGSTRGRRPTANLQKFNILAIFYPPLK